jgi:hypothetical protein
VLIRMRILQDDDFRQRMMDKFAEDERIEQMNAQKRRMKMLEHKREVRRSERALNLLLALLVQKHKH